MQEVYKTEEVLLEKHLKKISKEASINFLGSLVGTILGYVSIIILTSNLTPDQYGTFVLAFSIVSVFVIFSSLGIPPMLERYVPFLLGAGKRGEAKGLIFSSLKYILVLSLFLSMLLFFVSDFIALSIFKQPQLSLILKITILILPFWVFIQLVSSSFRALKELRYQVYINQFFIPLLKIVFALFIFSLGYSLIGWTIVHVGIFVGASAFALFFFKKLIIFFRDTRRRHVYTKEIISYSWPLIIIGIVSGLPFYFTSLILGYFYPASHVGIFRIYFMTAGMLTLVLASLAFIYRPIASELIGQEKIKPLRDIYQRASKWAFLISGFGFLVILFWGRQILSVFFPVDYVVFSVALTILAGGQLINNLVGPTGMTILAFGQSKALAFFVMGQIIVNLVLALVLIPRFGIVGGALAFASAVILVNTATLIYTFTEFGFQPFTWLYLRILLGFILLGLFTFFLFTSLSATAWGMILGVGGTMSGFVFLLVVTGILDATDKKILKNILGR